MVEGESVNGVADFVDINGNAIEAKYVEDWSKSLRNPDSSIGGESFAVAEQEKVLA